MNKVISISCSPSGQDINKILKVIQRIKLENPEATLFHTLIPKNYPIEICDKLKELFPEQEVFVTDVHQEPIRKSMAKAVARTNGKVYVIGTLKEEAKEEFEACLAAGATDYEILSLVAD